MSHQVLLGNNTTHMYTHICGYVHAHTQTQPFSDVLLGHTALSPGRKSNTFVFSSQGWGTFSLLTFRSRNQAGQLRTAGGKTQNGVGEGELSQWIRNSLATEGPHQIVLPKVLTSVAEAGTQKHLMNQNLVQECSKTAVNYE